MVDFPKAKSKTIQIRRVAVCLISLMFSVLPCQGVKADSVDQQGVGDTEDSNLFWEMLPFVLLVIAVGGSFVSLLLRFYALKRRVEVAEARVEELKEKKEAAGKRKDEIDRLQTLLIDILDSMPSVIIGVDNNIKVSQWNLGAEEFTGVCPEEARGKDLYQVFPELQVSRKDIMHSILDSEMMLYEKIPYATGRVDGYFDHTVNPVITSGFTGAVIRMDDVTRRAKLEEMMIQTEKMISVGSLAAGMAHEINNPLAGILQNSQVIQNRLFRDLPANRKKAEEAKISLENLRKYLDFRNIKELFQNVDDSGQRAAEIVKNMLTFSRKSTSGMIEQDVEALLEDAISLAQNEFDLSEKYDFQQVKISRKYSKNIPKISCQQSKIQQVFLNILQNAVHAISMNKNQGNPEIIIRTKLEGKYIRIEFQDNGVGMDEAVKRRIFEPFYSTKEVGMGTGLGLSVSYFIISENHKGIFLVESEKMKGSRFIVKLPVGEV